VLFASDLVGVMQSELLIAFPVGAEHDNGVFVGLGG
jgi:hypothetical protein